MSSDKLVKFDEVDSKLLDIRDQKILLDSDIAHLYGVETRDINQAVKNNPDKFPDDYIFQLTKAELENLRWKFSTTKFSKTRTLPKAFTEKGLYMLATIIKSKRGTSTTLAIIETYARLKNLARNIKELSVAQDKDKKQSLMHKSGEIITELLEDDLNVNETETSIELNFAVLKLKHTIKKKKK